MKILRLGTSQDEQSGIAREAALNTLLEKGIAAELGEPVEMVVKRAWPTPMLRMKVREWMEEVQPDVVLIPAVAYWFMYQSVPLKLKRRFGKAGDALNAAGQKAAQTSWLSHNAIFRTGREVATRIIGGASPFSAEEVAESIVGCIKEAVRHEGVVVYVDGPSAHTRFSRSARVTRRLEKDRLYVTARLAEVCAQYHVTFRAYDTQMWTTGIKIQRRGDGLHLTATGNETVAQQYIQTIAAIVRESREREGMSAGR